MDQSLAEEFIIESKEHLATIEEDLLALEKQADSPDRSLVDKLFRAMHSIKGGAGFLGLKNVNNLAHRMETILALVRSAEMKPTQQVVEILLKGSDQIAGMLDDLGNSDSVEVGALLVALDQILEAKAPPSAKQAMVTPAPIQVKATKAKYPFSVSVFDLKNRRPENQFLYVFRFDLTAMARAGGLSPVGVVRELLRCGEIVDGHLEAPVIDLRQGVPDALCYDALFATPIPEEVLGSLLLDSLHVPDLEVIAVEEGEVQLADPEAPPAPSASPAPPPVAAAPAKPVPTPATAPATATPPAPKPAPVGAVPPPSPAPSKPSTASPPPPKTTAPPVSSQPSQELKAVGNPAATTPAVASPEVANTVRINVEILDELMTLAGELVLVRNQQLMISEKADVGLRTAIQRLNLVATELQETIMRTRMQPMGNLFSRFPRVVRDIGNKLGKQIELDISGNDVEVDKTILESLTDPMKHLVRNSCDHGLETTEQRIEAGKDQVGTIRLRAYHEAGQINIEIADDGRGVNIPRVKAKALENGLKTKTELDAMSDKEAVRLIFLPGFSTAEVVTDMSGRGVGMDVVKTSIEKLGGQLDIDTKPGEGTTIHLRLPLTLAIIPCLIVGVGGHRYAIPQVNLEELVCLYDQEVEEKIECAREQEVFRLRDHLLPLVRLEELMARPQAFTQKDRVEITRRNQLARAEMAKKGESLTFAVVKVGLKRFGLVVDRVVGTEEIVVKPMHAAVKHLRCCSGATVMGDGQVALILDIEGLARHAGLASDGLNRTATESRNIADVQTDAHSMLIFRSGVKEQFSLALPLIKRIEPITTDRIERVGEKEFVTIDGVPASVLRLDQLIGVSPCVDKKELFLLLPKHTNKPCGLLVSEVVDIEDAAVDLETAAHREDGILGSAIVRGKLTVFPDLYRLIEKADPAEKPVQREGRKQRVLLAEDTSFFRQLVRGYLESGGFEVDAAENGQIALELYNESDYDILVSDLEMPVMNGWELMKKVRAGTRNPRIPAIALTGLSSEESVAAAMSAGFDKYEVKMDRARFLDTVNDCIDRGAKRPLAGARS